MTRTGTSRRQRRPIRAAGARRAPGDDAPRLAPAVAAILVGLVLIGMTLALSLFRDAPAGERVTDRFRSTLTERGLTDLQRNFATTGAMGDEFLTQMLPDLQRELGMSDPEFDAYLEETAPAALVARDELGPAVELVTPVVPQLVGVREDFESVDELPLAGLPLSSVPWLLLGAGVGLIAVGIAGLRWPGSRRTVTAIVAVAGLALVVVPLAIDLPGKADAADHVDRVGQVALSPVAATTAKSTTDTVDRLVTQVGDSLVPDVAERRGDDPKEVLASVAREYPAVAAGMDSWPQIRPGAYELAAAQAASVPDYDNLHEIPFGALPWLLIVPGVVLLVTGGIALVRLR